MLKTVCYLDLYMAYIYIFKCEIIAAIFENVCI